jgi:acyl-CoA synthetase (AMP-forming)/AMP-acid ligase II
MAGAPDADRLAAILYTSGSTGMPRGVTLTHGNLGANTQQILDYLRLTADDSVTVVLPFHYSFGNSLLLTHVKVGGRLVVDNRFAFPQTILETMERERTTGFSGVPSTYAILCAKTDFLTRPHADLRYLTQAGGAMPPALTRRLREALPPRIALFVMYGQTEASARLSYLPPERLLEKLGSIGIAIPGVTLTLRHDDGAECGVGEVGEIVASGPNIMRGYWNDPEETAKVLKADGLHTGDLARKDEDGFIFIVDRIRNMIKSGAHRISAKEIEETIAELPGVAEACVIGVPDDLLGEAIEAFVVPAPGARVDGRGVAAGASSGGRAATGTAPRLDAQAILRHCNANLAKFKIPRAIHFRDSLPKNSFGKVIKAELLPQR